MLKSRLITAILLAGLFVAALLMLPDIFWALFLLAFIVVGAWEWGELSGFGRSRSLGYAAITLVIGLLLSPGLTPFEALRSWGALLFVGAAALFWIVVAPLWLARQWHIRHKGLSVCTGWVLLMPPWIALLDLRHIGPSAVLLAICTVALADSAAYFSGKRYGKRKLAPAISPGKTWEGLIGALAVVSLFATGFCLWAGWSAWFVVGALAVTILSVMGDLFESMIKRQAGKKDSGRMLPGHGGVLDRIDGLTSTLPLIAFYTYLPVYLRVLSAS